MIAELKSAYAAKKPILMMFWAPHWLHAELDFHWTEFPPYQAGCDTDPKLGMTPDNVNDCGFEQAHIEKIVWHGFQSKWPAAYKLLQAFQLDNATQNRLMLDIDQKSRPLEQVIAEWMNANEKTWKAWVDAASM